MVVGLRLGIAGLLLLCLVEAPKTGALIEDAQIAEDEQVLKIAGLASDGSGLLHFLRGLIPTPQEQNQLEGLVRRLGAKDFRMREQAKTALLAAGPRALPALRLARQSTDLEIQVRAERCLKLLELPLTTLVPAVVRLLPVRKPAGAVPVLLAYLPCADGETLAEEIHTALVGLAPGREGDRNAMYNAMGSLVPSQRGAAALAMAYRGDETDRAKVRMLLIDSEDGVRFRAAQGLLAAGDISVVPVLVDLLGRSETIGHRAEDVLLQLAGDTAPATFLENQPAARRECQAAWKTWWQSRPARFLPPRIQVTACPNRRARAIAFQFLHALFQGDFGTLKKAAAVPFNLAGVLTLQTQTEFDQIFGEVLEAQQKNRPPNTFQLMKVVGRDEFLRDATEGERGFLDRLPKDEIRVVYLRGRFGAEKLDEGALWVRVSGCRAHVIGFGRGQSSPLAPTQK